jgi:pimeloyl-ACP methyl ester carboxylesterase
MSESSSRWLQWGKAAASLSPMFWLAKHLSAPAVQEWRPAAGTQRMVGNLSVRVLGNGERTFVLLHGLLGSGDCFSGAYNRLATEGTLIVPDLLGFGHSMTHEAIEFGLEAQLDALDVMIKGLDLSERKLVIAGHSMGALLAIYWGARWPKRTEKIVAFSAPFYESQEDAQQKVSQMGWKERLFALDGLPGRKMCAWMCEHRELSSYLSIAAKPELPIEISRAGVRHTWKSYLGGMNVIVQGTWPTELQTLEEAKVPLILADGINDTVVDHRLAVQLQEQHSNIQRIMHPWASHYLPLEDPLWSVKTLIETC